MAKYTVIPAKERDRLRDLLYMIRVGESMDVEVFHIRINYKKQMIPLRGIKELPEKVLILRGLTSEEAFRGSGRFTCIRTYLEQSAHRFGIEALMIADISMSRFREHIAELPDWKLYPESGRILPSYYKLVYPRILQKELT